MKSTTRSFILAAAALCAGLLSVPAKAASTTDSADVKKLLDGVTLEYDAPAASDLPQITSLAVCPADELTTKGVYSPAQVIKELEMLPNFKAISPRAVIKLVGKDETDLSEASSAERKESMAKIAKATGADVLYVRQVGEMSKKIGYQVIRSKASLQFNLEIDLYVAKTDTVWTQNATLSVTFGVGVFSKQKLTEDMIRAAFAADLKSRILGSHSGQLVASN